LKFINSVSESIRFINKHPKYLLTKAFEDLIPYEIVNRKKYGFSFPFQIWMRHNIGHISDFIKNKSNPLVKKLINSFNNNGLHWSRYWAIAVVSQKGSI